MRAKRPPSKDRKNPARIEDVAGCLKYDGPTKTLEEMDAAITAEAKKRYKRADAQAAGEEIIQESGSEEFSIVSPELNAELNGLPRRRQRRLLAMTVLQIRHREGAPAPVAIHRTHDGLLRSARNDEKEGT